MFDANGQTIMPTGYQIQYRIQPSNVWQNGTSIQPMDGVTLYNITLDNLQADTAYQLRVVPLIDHDGIIYIGVPSPQANVYIFAANGGMFQILLQITACLP